MGKRKFKKTNFPTQQIKEQKVLEINYLEVAKRTFRKLKDRIKKYG